MMLIVYYVGLAFVGNAIAIVICLGIEKLLPEASMPVFLIAFFVVLWGAWVLAVRLSEPQIEPAPTDGATGDQRA